MLTRYQLTLYSDGDLLDSLKFSCYDDFSATHKANRIYSFGYYETVRLTKNGKKVKTFGK